MKELILEAKKRVAEIVEKSQIEQPESYLAIYESDNGYAIGWIKIGWNTRTNMIAFGSKEINKNDVFETINYHEQMIREYDR